MAPKKRMKTEEKDRKQRKAEIMELNRKVLNRRIKKKKKNRIEKGI
jgi:hypothetical protein